jgi:hypothetical protein
VRRHEAVLGVVARQPLSSHVEVVMRRHAAACGLHSYPVLATQPLLSLLLLSSILVTICVAAAAATHAAAAAVAVAFQPRHKLAELWQQSLDPTLRG